MKKDRIITTAMALFFKHGFRKVTIDEICTKAQTSRKTYYSYFKNKEELVFLIVKEIIEKAMLAYENIIKEDICFTEKLEKILLTKIEASKAWSMEFVSDFMTMDSKVIMQYYNDALDHSLEMMNNWLKESQQKGDISPGINIDYINWSLKRQVEHFDSPELQKMFASVEDMIKQITQVVVFGISPVNKK